MSVIFDAFKRQLGRDAGKVVTNYLFKDKHATPIRVIRAQEAQKRRNHAAGHTIAIQQAHDNKIKENTAIIESNENLLLLIQNIHNLPIKKIDWNKSLQGEDDFSGKEINDISNKIKNNGQLRLKKLVNSKNIQVYLEAKAQSDFTDQELFNGISAYFDQYFDNLIQYKTQKIKDQDFIENEENRLNQQFIDNLVDKKLSQQVLNKEKSVYLSVINQLNLFQRFEKYGSEIFIGGENNMVFINAHVHDESFVPAVKMRLLKSGQINQSDVSIEDINKAYQDYICSLILAIGKVMMNSFYEDEIIIKVFGSNLNTATGHYEDKLLVVIKFTREAFEKLNYMLVDPSDSMENFEHKMDFTLKSGFKEVQD